jgi:hypothetical protein
MSEIVSATGMNQLKMQDIRIKTCQIQSDMFVAAQERG